MINIKPMINLVVVVKNRDGDKIAGRLVEIEENYIKLRFKTGMEAYLAVEDILFIAPVKKQPAELV